MRDTAKQSVMKWAKQAASCQNPSSVSVYIPVHTMGYLYTYTSPNFPSIIFASNLFFLVKEVIMHSLTSTPVVKV